MWVKVAFAADSPSLQWSYHGGTLRAAGAEREREREACMVSLIELHKDSRHLLTLSPTMLAIHLKCLFACMVIAVVMMMIVTL